MTWKRFPHHWSFVNGMYWSLVNFSPKWAAIQRFYVSFDVGMNYLLEKSLTVLPKTLFLFVMYLWCCESLLLPVAWWRHQMETFSALLAICAGNSPVPGEFPTQRPVTRSFDVFFGLRLNKRLSKQSWGWWFETLSRPLWRHRNEFSSRNFICLSKWIKE